MLFSFARCYRLWLRAVAASFKPFTRDFSAGITPGRACAGLSLATPTNWLARSEAGVN